MSDRIEEILEVIQEVQRGIIGPRSLGRLTELRIDATKKIALERGIARETVQDKFRRQLYPDVTGTRDFDVLLKAWLRDDSMELRNVLLKHAVDTWDEKRIKAFFSRNVNEPLASSAQTLRTTLAIPSLSSTASHQAKESTTHYEGATRQVLATRYERDPVARAKCLQYYGLNCFICGFNFGETYGPEAEGIIHVHHLIPLSQIGRKDEFDPIRDLRPVCPNCHAVIHRHKKAYSVAAVRQMLHPKGNT